MFVATPIAFVLGLLLLALVDQPVLAQTAAPAEPTVAEVFALSLSKAQELFRENNRSVRTALRQSAIASAEVYRVNVSPNPTLSGQIANSEPNRYRPSGTDRLIRLDQLIERGGKRELRTRQAQLLEQSSKWVLADVLRQQSVQLSHAYYELAAAQELLTIARQNLQAYERLQSAAQRRQAAGDLAAVDVLRLNVEGGRAANELRNAQAQAQQAQIVLAISLGHERASNQLKAIDPLPSGTDISNTIAALTQNSEQLHTQLQTRRADVLAAQLRVDAAEQAVALANSLRSRDVSVGVQAERPAHIGGHVFGIGVTIPLLINNEFSGDIARALAERDAALEDRDRQRAQVRSDIERALSQLRDAQDRSLRLINQTLPQAAQVVSAIEFAFSKGAATLTDLFDARRQRAAVLTETVTAQADFAKAYASYTAATQLENLP